MCKDKDTVVTTVRMPERLIAAVDKFAELHSMSRTSSINYLLTKGLIHEGGLDNVFNRINEINKGNSKLIERDLIDDEKI